MVNVWIVISWGSCLRLASSCVRLICGPALPALFFLWISTSFSGIAHLLDQGLSWVLLLLLSLQIHLGLLMSLVFLLCLWGFFSVFMCLWSYYILRVLLGLLMSWISLPCHLRFFEHDLFILLASFLSPSFCGSDGNGRPLVFFFQTCLCHLRILSNIR